MAVHFNRTDCEGFQEMLHIQCMDETENMLWNGSEEDGNIRIKCEEYENADCENGDVALIGKGR
jgi:hypothetical protein